MKRCRVACEKGHSACWLPAPPAVPLPYVVKGTVAGAAPSPPPAVSSASVALGEVDARAAKVPEQSAKQETCGMPGMRVEGIGRTNAAARGGKLGAQAIGKTPHTSNSLHQQAHRHTAGGKAMRNAGPAGRVGRGGWHHMRARTQAGGGDTRVQSRPTWSGRCSRRRAGRRKAYREKPPAAP